ncbi:hypothetical protein MW887_004402 [Aspergillus wentii]|nr:hypothetical protein MW887_004402 [Aspergillus wentii]
MDEKEISVDVSDNNNESPPLDWRVWSIFISLGLLSFISCLESTILVPVLPSISKALNGSTSSALWTGSAYLLTVAVFNTLIGGLSEEFDHRKLLLISISLFCIGALICSVSHSMTPFLVGRAIQGTGGGGMRALVNMIPTAMVSLRRRPAAIMLTQVGYMAGSILGPIVGGFIGEYTTWRWIFYLNFPLCGLVLPVVVFVMKDKNDKERSFADRVRRLDWIGAILFLASSCSLLIGVMWGGEQFPWRSWRTLLPIACGAFGLIVALLWEGYGSSAPFIDLSSFKVPSANAIYAGGFLQGLLLYCQLYYLPVYFEGVRGYSSSHTGLAYLPVTCTMIIASLASGMLMRKIPRLRWMIIAGWTLAALSSGLLFLFNAAFETYKWVLVFLVSGFGHGVSTTSTLLQNSLRSHGSQTGVESSLMQMTDLAAHPDLPPALLNSFQYMCAVVTGVSALGLVLSFVFATPKIERIGQA